LSIRGFIELVFSSLGGRLQSGDYQEPGCSRNARDQPGPLSRRHGGRRRLASAGAAPTWPAR